MSRIRDSRLFTIRPGLTAYARRYDRGCNVILEGIDDDNRAIRLSLPGDTLQELLDEINKKEETNE